MVEPPCGSFRVITAIFPVCEFLGFLRYLFLFGPAHVILTKFLQDAEDTELRN